MKCNYCLNKAVFKTVNKVFECNSHFIKRFENTIIKTIKENKLLKNSDKILVGVSGGKDSLAVLYVLKKFFKNEIKALLVDEGIKGYRSKTIVIAKKYCKKWGVELIIKSFKKEKGKTLDEIKKKINKAPCYPCGVFRREILNKVARSLGFDKLVSGHNLDDEVQAILMNFFMGDLNRQSRMGYSTGVIKNKGFVTRIKPLRNLTEKEVMLYNQLKGFLQSFKECPNVNLSYRIKIRDFLNEYELKNPGTKFNILKSYETWIKKGINKDLIMKEINDCAKCDEPTSGVYCKSCKLKEEVFSSK